MAIATGEVATAADVNTALGLRVLKSLFDAHTILISVSDDTPVKLDVAASRIVGRKSSGNIVALTGAELMAILSGQAGAAFGLNAQRITNIGAHTTAGDALRKGTRQALTDMPALTTDKIWKGVGGVPAEADVPTSRTIATGTYSGNGADDRQITTSFKCSMVILFSETTKFLWAVLPDGTLQLDSQGVMLVTTDALLHATDGFVVDENYANKTTYDPYNYWAISE